MKLSQKKNCNGCKAGWYECSPFRQICDLRYKVKSSKLTGIPLEPCYKPMSNNKVIEARDLINSKVEAK